MHKVFKYVLLPTSEQQKILLNYTGACRWLWNFFLGVNINQYYEDKTFIFRNQMLTSLPKLKDAYPWLKEIPSQALQQRLIDLDNAIQRSFKSGFGFPKFKPKKASFQSIRIPQIAKPTKLGIRVPKLGWIKWNKDRPLEGKLKSVTIKYENSKWYCICICELPEVQSISKVSNTEIVGIDVGLQKVLTTSNNQTFPTPAFYRTSEKKLAKLQRKLSRKVKGSKNREKARLRLTKQHNKVRNQRLDFLHKTSNVIAKQYKIVGVEDLNLKGMTKFLSKSIYDQGLGILLGQLSYKTKWNGGHFIKVDRWFPSSQICSSCGNRKPMSLSERVYSCTCGLVIDRDLNAAINIKQETIRELHRTGTVRIYACGDTSDGDAGYHVSSHVSLNQEKHSTVVDTASA